MASGRRGYRTIQLELRAGDVVPVRASARVADALADISKNATLYEGVRLMQVMEAVYAQGKKDGAREVFEELDRSLDETKKQIPHRRPGRPRSRN